MSSTSRTYVRAREPAPLRLHDGDTVATWEATGMRDRGHRPGEGDQIASRDGQPVLRYDDAQPTRETSGDVSLMAMYAGTSVQAITQVEPASQIVKRITQGL